MACSKYEMREVLLRDIRELRSEIRNGKTEDDNGVDLQDRLDTVTKLYDSVKQNKMNELQSIIDDHNAKLDNETLQSLRSEFGSNITVAYNGSKTTADLRIENAKIEGDVITITTPKGTWSFLQGQDRSKDTKSGKFVVVKGLGEITNTFNIKPTTDINEQLQKESNLESVKEFPELATAIKDELSKIYPEINVKELDTVLDHYGNEVLGKTINGAIEYSKDSKLDTLPHEYAHVYVDLLEQTTFVKNLLETIQTKFELNNQAAKEYLVSHMGKQYVEHIKSKAKSNTKIDSIYSMIKDLWNKIIRVFSNKDLLTIQDKMDLLSTRFNKGINRDSIRFSPKEGFEKVNTELTFKDQPFAASVLKGLMQVVPLNKVMFTGSAALALQGNVYRKGKDGITDLHDLDIAVDSTETQDKLFNYLWRNYNIESIYDFSVQQVITGKDGVEKRVKTIIVVPKQYKVDRKSIVRTRGEVGRVIAYNIIDSNKKIVGRYAAKTRYLNGKNTITEEYTTGFKAVTVDLLEDDFTERSAPIIYNSPTLNTDISISDYKDIFDAKNNMALETKGVARDKDVMDMNLFKTKEELSFGNSKKADESKIDWKKLKKVGEGVHGINEQMKSFMRMINELGKGKATEEDIKFYDELIDKFKPEFFTKLDLYYDKVSKNEEQFGYINSNKLVLTYSKRSKLAGNEQSEAEIYMHETIHSMVMFALRSGAPVADKIRRELTYAMRQVAKEVNWRDLLPYSTNKINTELEKEIAMNMYDYIFNDENALDEFIAHALTNPILRKKLQKLPIKDSTSSNKTWLDKVMGFFSTLMDIVLGRYTFKEKDNNVYDQVLKLTLELGAINNKAIASAESEFNIVNKINQALDFADEYTSNKIDQAIAFVIGQDASKSMEILPPNASKLDKAKWLAKYAKMLLSNETYRNYFGHVLSAIWVRPEGVVRDMTREMFDKNSIQKSAEMLSLAANNIDKERESKVDATASIVYSLFDKKLTDLEKNSLTSVVLDTDLQSISNEYNNQELRKLLENDEYLETQIGRHKHALDKLASSTADRNWFVTQANGLGYYMATGKANITQMLNAVNIARGLGSSKRKKINWNIVKEIDTIATLVAIKETKRNKRKEVLTVASLMKTDYKGVHGVMNMQYNLVKDSKEQLFDESNTNIVKGYTKNVFDSSVTIEMAPIADKEKMEQRGFVLKGEVTSNKALKNAPKMGVFISTAFSTSDWHRASVRLASRHAMGTNMHEIRNIEDPVLGDKKAELDIMRLDMERAKIVAAIENGTYKADEIENNMLPMLNPITGDIVNYRYIMNKNLKEEALKQDLDVGNVLGRSYGSVYDKSISLVHNQKVLDFIVNNMNDNWVTGTSMGKNGEEYYVITENTDNANLAEIYKILPASYKEFIRNDPRGAIAIPANLLNILFGFREQSIANIPFIKDITPTVVTTAIKIAEAIWFELVKIAKGNIMIKMPMVLISNIKSNIVYLLNRGGSVNVLDLVKAHIDAFRDLRRHIKDERRANQIKAELNTLRGDLNKRQMLTEELNRLENDMKNNWTHLLFELGMYTPMTEDVEVKTETTNKLKKAIDKQLDKLPSFMKTPLQYLYLSEETAIHKFNQEVLQMSDLVSRAVLMKKLELDKQAILNGKLKIPTTVVNEMNKKLKDSNIDTNAKVIPPELIKLFNEEYKKYAEYNILESFINYEAAPSSTESYLNKSGAVLFTPYAKRIQRVIKNLTSEHPIRSALITLLDKYAIDLDIVQDQQFMVKSWYNMGIKEEGDLPGISPLDHLISVATPALIKKETYGL